MIEQAEPTPPFPPPPPPPQVPTQPAKVPRQTAQPPPAKVPTPPAKPPPGHVVRKKIEEKWRKALNPRMKVILRSQRCNETVAELPDKEEHAEDPEAHHPYRKDGIPSRVVFDPSPFILSALCPPPLGPLELRPGRASQGPEGGAPIRAQTRESPLVPRPGRAH